MLQRILGGVLVLLGLVAAALGVASATVWRDTDTVVATAKPTGDGTLVVTDPGVLGLVGDDVTVSASVPEGQKVTLVVGRDIDVAGWVGNDPYSHVTGLSDWDTLSVAEGASADADAEAEKGSEPSVGPDPAGSDMWLAEASDEGSVTLRWSDRPGRWTMLAAGVGDDAAAPTLELTWHRAVSTPYLWPGVGVGVVLVVIGAVLLVLGGRRVRADRAELPDGADGAGDGQDDATPADHHDDGPSAGGASPFGPVRPGSAPAAPVTPVTPGVQPEPDEPASGSSDADAEDDGTTRDATSTAEVPLTSRLLRRSRRGRREEQADATSSSDAPGEAEQGTAGADLGGSPAVPVPAPAVPVPAGPTPHEPVPAEPTTATGALRMTRRELRAQEEARRASEQGGMTRMLRAVTGSIPTVRSQQPAAGTEGASPTRPDTSTPAGRAAAWRATWGFGDASRSGQAADGADPRPTDTDGENR